MLCFNSVIIITLEIWQSSFIDYTELLINIKELRLYVCNLNPLLPSFTLGFPEVFAN